MVFTSKVKAMRLRRISMFLCVSISLLISCSIVFTIGCSTDNKNDSGRNGEVEIMEGDQRYLIFGMWNFEEYIPDYDTFKEVLDAAIDAGCNSVRLHIPWYRLEPEPGRYDFDLYDRQLDYIINEKGLKVGIHIDLTVKTNTGKEPVVPVTELQVDSNGKVCDAGIVSRGRSVISFASEDAMAKAANIMDVAVRRYYEKYPNESILFYQSTFSQYCETEYWLDKLYDYSEPAMIKFRNWLPSNYSSISELNENWGANYTSFDEVEPPKDFKGNKGLLWYQFRHKMLKAAIDKMADTVHAVDPGLKFCVQFGSTWDKPIDYRGTAAFTDLCEKAQVVWVDDAPTYNFAWSMDLMRASLPGKEIANEIDGPHHIKDGTGDVYYNQGKISFEHGAKYVSVANWIRVSDIEKYRSIFTRLAEECLPYPVPKGEDKRPVLKVSAYDAFRSGTGKSQRDYNKLSSNGKKWVDVILADDLTNKGLQIYSATQQASVDYGSEQGQNNWHYQEWNGKEYADMKWEAGNNYWKGSAQFAIIGVDWQHPDTTDSVRKWISAKSGEITIAANGVISVSEGDGADGVKLKVMHNSRQLWPQDGWYTIPAGGFYEFEPLKVQVDNGDEILFIVNKNGNSAYDTTTWDPVITY